jgi:hypothetical protein
MTELRGPAAPCRFPSPWIGNRGLDHSMHVLVQGSVPSPPSKTSARCKGEVWN